MTWLSNKLMNNKGVSLFETLLILSILALTTSLLFQGRPLSSDRMSARINMGMLQKQLQTTRFIAVQSDKAQSFEFPQDILERLCDNADAPNLVFYPDGTNSSGRLCIKSQKTFAILEIDKFTGILITRDTR